jgi:BirA family biotin operon repressor/biotin-[acetyl-CoA-carboxylase] ligase
LQKNTFSDGFVGRNLITLPTVASTNDYLKEKLANSAPLPEGTVIMAVHQTQGRGQQGAEWTSAPGENLTFSLLLDPKTIQPVHQFALTVSISLAMVECLEDLLPQSHTVKIKWPNDIYVDGRKIAGILIENILAGKHWKHAIIGIGLNVNQTEFPESVREKATSLKLITGQHYELMEIFQPLCHRIEENFEGLESAADPVLFGQYVNKLYRLNETAEFLIDGVKVNGKIVGVTPYGKLKVDFNNNHMVEFGIKEIAFL